MTKRERREWEDIQGDATVFRSYIREVGETPMMTASNRDHWQARATAAEAELATLRAARPTPQVDDADNAMNKRP